MIQRPPFKVFAGTNTRYLAEKICNSLGCELGKMNIQHFADGEFSVSFEESIRGCQVFLIQSTYPNADNLMELLLMIDAAKRASAESIIAVTPYFGWARQDRKDKPESIYRRQADCRPVERCRHRPSHHHGLARRPDSGLLRRTRSTTSMPRQYSANTSNRSTSKIWLSPHPTSEVQNGPIPTPNTSVYLWYCATNREPKPTKWRA